MLYQVLSGYALLLLKDMVQLGKTGSIKHHS